MSDRVREYPKKYETGLYADQPVLMRNTHEWDTLRVNTQQERWMRTRATGIEGQTQRRTVKRKSKLDLPTALSPIRRILNKYSLNSNKNPMKQEKRLLNGEGGLYAKKHEKKLIYEVVSVINVLIWCIVIGLSSLAVIASTRGFVYSGQQKTVKYTHSHTYGHFGIQQVQKE